MSLSKPVISLIVACSQNGVIGVNNQLPWHLPRDLEWFKQHTRNKVVIMGRKTFASIGKPLPKRTNVVLSRQKISTQGVTWSPSLDSALQQFSQAKEIMIIGGGQVYAQALPLAQRIYLTEVQTQLEGDAFFPSLNLQEWQIRQQDFVEKDEHNQFDMRFLILERK